MDEERTELILEIDRIGVAGRFADVHSSLDCVLRLIEPDVHEQAEDGLGMDGVHRPGHAPVDDDRLFRMPVNNDVGAVRVRVVIAFYERLHVVMPKVEHALHPFLNVKKSTGKFSRFHPSDVLHHEYALRDLVNLGDVKRPELGNHFAMYVHDLGLAP